MVLRKPPAGQPVTARQYLNFYKAHLIMLSQMYYPLTYYVEDDMKSYIETFFKEENLRFLPEDIQCEGIVSFAQLSNRALIYVAQLSIRPTSREKWLEALWSCPRPPKPNSHDSFIDQGVHFNYNMALLNSIHENVDYLNLNGGSRHMPPFNWKQDPDRSGPSGRKLALGLARVVSEMLSGLLAPRLIIHFRPRTSEEESETALVPSPNFGKPREPTTVAELMVAFRAIYRYYFLFADCIKRVKEDYEGTDSSSSNSSYDQARERARKPKELSRDQSYEYSRDEGREQRHQGVRHPALRVLESANEVGNEQLLNVVHAFASDAGELLLRMDDDKIDSAIDTVYTEHLEHLQAMSNAGVCFSAMLSPSAQCLKPKCPHRHDKEAFMYGVVEQIVKYMATQGYRDAINAGLIEPIKVKSGWDLAIPPPAARATLPQRNQDIRPAARPTASQVPFSTPQSARYAPRAEHKLHVTSQIRPNDWEPPEVEYSDSDDTEEPGWVTVPELEPLETEDENVPEMESLHDPTPAIFRVPYPPLPRLHNFELTRNQMDRIIRELQSEQVVRQDLTQEDEASLGPGQLYLHFPESFPEESPGSTLDESLLKSPRRADPSLGMSKLPYEMLEGGRRLYHLSNSVVAGMPMLPVLLSCGVNLESHGFQVDAPMDTGATMCYLSNSLFEELQPYLHPRSVKRIRSRVRMGAPPDHQSEFQVDLKVQWEYEGHTKAAILRFVILHTDNLRIILGLNAILLAGLLEPLIKNLRLIREQALELSSMYWLEVKAEEDIPTYSLHVTGSSSASEFSPDSYIAPFPGGGQPPTTIPQRAQVVLPSMFPLAETAHGYRHVDLCPLLSLRSDELDTWPEAQQDHDIAIQRFMRDDQLSYVQRFALSIGWALIISCIKRLSHHPLANQTTTAATLFGMALQFGDGVYSPALEIPCDLLLTTLMKKLPSSYTLTASERTSGHSARVACDP